MSENVIQIENISKAFGGVKALTNVSTQIKKGKIHAIIGPNGSGKTTLINIITGFYKPDTGKIVYKGKEITSTAPHNIARIGIGRTFQNLRLFDSMDVKENVKVAYDQKLKETILQSIIGSKKVKVEEQEADRKVIKLLEKLGLTEIKDKNVAGLPYGLRRMVEIARALSLNPEVLLLDEPVAGMNSTESIELMNKMKRIVDEGITLILIEHDMKVVMGYSDQITVLNHGEVIACGCPSDIQSNPAVIEAYLGKKREREFLNEGGQ